MNVRRKTWVGSGRVKVSMAAPTAVFGLLAILLGGSAPSSAQSEFFEGSFRVKGHAGNEFVDITWASGGEGGHIGEKFFNDTDWHELAVNVPAHAQTVRITFHNDGLNDDGSDRNVIVDYFEINGVRIETESDEVFSVGVYNGVDCGEGYRNSEFLACNGYFEFNVDDIIDPPQPPGDDQIVIAAQGATGTEMMAIEVDGEIRTTWTVSAGSADYIYDGPIVEPHQQLRILFTNDGLTDTGADRNLQVGLINVYGELFDPIELESKGVWNGTDCGIGFRSSRWLHCNGWFDVPGTSEPPPPPQETVEFSVFAAGSAGDELVGVVINDEVWSAFELDTDFYVYTLRVPRPPYDSFYFVFANDGLSDSGVDRNVYVESFALDNTYIDPRDLESLGNWNGSDCGQGYRNSPWLHCNGWFDILSGGDEPPPPPPEEGIVAAFVGQGTTGAERVGFEINGEVAASWELSTTDERYEVILPDQPIDSAQVVFLNDAVTEAGDRNVRISSIELDGTTYDPRDLESKGSYNGVDCGIGFRNSNWLHCNGWFDLGLGDPPPPPNPDLNAPTDLACSRLPALDPDVPFQVTEWTWTDNSPGLNYAIDVREGGVVQTFGMEPGTTSFLYEVASSDTEVTEIAVVYGEERAAASTAGIQCTDLSQSHQFAYSDIVFGDNPGAITVEVPHVGVGNDFVLGYFVELVGDSFVMTYNAPIDLSNPRDITAVPFTGVPVDEVVTVIVSTCYRGEITKCLRNGTPTNYHIPQGFYVDAGVEPSNPNLAAPANFAIESTLPTALIWDELPYDGEGAPPQYQIRRFEEDGPLGWQWALGSRHPERLLDIRGGSVTIPYTHYAVFGEQRWRYEVRGCDANGCGPWSESSDWVDNDGNVTPYEP